jgi:hypothetical protein
MDRRGWRPGFAGGAGAWVIGVLRVILQANAAGARCCGAAQFSGA